MSVKKLLWLSLFCWLPAVSLWGQSAQTEGTVEFKMEYKNLPQEMAGIEAMLPNTMVIRFKGEKTALDIPSFMGRNTVISNGNERITLMEMGENRYALRNKVTSEAAEPEIKYELEEKPETRMILGYPCKLMIARFVQDGKKLEAKIWYTNQVKITLPKTRQLPGIPLKGTPLRWEMQMPEINAQVVMEAIKFETEPVADSYFDIPPTFNETTREQLIQELGFDPFNPRGLGGR